MFDQVIARASFVYKEDMQYKWRIMMDGKFRMEFNTVGLAKVRVDNKNCSHKKVHL